MACLAATAHQPVILGDTETVEPFWEGLGSCESNGINLGLTKTMLFWMLMGSYAGWWLTYHCG